MKPLNNRLWGRALDRAVPETYTTLNAYQLSKAIDEYTELVVKECMRMCDVAAIGYESHGHMKEANGCYSAKEYIEDHFGVE